MKQELFQDVHSVLHVTVYDEDKAGYRYSFEYINFIYNLFIFKKYILKGVSSEN